MPDPTQVHIGKRVAKTPLTALNGPMALETMVDAARECFEVNQVERTRRAYIRGYREAEVRRIRGAEAILKKYFEQVFAERRKNFSELFRASTRHSTRATERCSTSFYAASWT